MRRACESGGGLEDDEAAAALMTMEIEVWMWKYVGWKLSKLCYKGEDAEREIIAGMRAGPLVEIQ